MRKGISGGLAGLTALSVAGNTLIGLPLTYNDASDIISLFVAAAFSFLLIIFFYPAVSDFFGSDNLSNKNVFRILRIGIYLFFEAVLILIAVTTLCDFAEFTISAVLPQVNKGLILIAFWVVALIVGCGSTSALSKTATLSLLTVAVLTVLIFVFSVPDMSFKYIKPRESFQIYSVLKSSFTLFLKSFAPSFALISVVGGKLSDKKSLLIGTAVGGGVLLLALLNTLFVFGGELSGALGYPYLSAVKTVGEKDVLSGMEGFLYVVLFLSCIVKAALSVFGIKRLSGEIKNIKNFQ